MKTMIKSVLLLVTIALLTAPALLAQGKNQKNNQQQNQPTLVERLAQLQKELVLTDEQVAKIKPLMEANRQQNIEQRKQMQAERKADRANRRAKMIEMRKMTAKNQLQMNTSLKEILTAEQFEKLQEFQKKQREEMMKNKPNGKN
jgi:Spy/CpxP family protein refolding chaperone